MGESFFSSALTFSLLHFVSFTRTTPSPSFNWNPPPVQPIPPSEDCLSINIYRCTKAVRISPIIPMPLFLTFSLQLSQMLLPVLVYIHEDHWLKRSNANLEPSSVINQLACNGHSPGGMLVLSFNYRMGPFGFVIFSFI
jgi:carboxylesterase type B